jgi:hypothetical protein
MISIGWVAAAGKDLKKLIFEVPQSTRILIANMITQPYTRASIV